MAGLGLNKQQRTRIKICGLTRQQDVVQAARAGADAIGFVFYPHSKRAITIEQAVSLRASVPAFVSVVALFVNAQPAEVQAVIDAIEPDLLQFHGDEIPEQCRQYGRPYMRAIRVGGPDTQTSEQVLEVASRYHDAAAWLFDTHTQAYGGSGQVFDHGLLNGIRKQAAHQAWVLAGGLNASTVGSAITSLGPYAVDVSSGVEQAPGIKSLQKVEQFIQAVADADRAPGAA